MSALITVHKGDITQATAEAIVNAANSHLRGGGGVDGAIHRAAGPQLLRACQRIYRMHGECNPGYAVITGAYNIPATYIIHAVGPVWHGGTEGEEEILHHAYTYSLQLAQTHKVSTIAFPNISTGVYGFPKPLAAKVVHRALHDYLRMRDTHGFTHIMLFCFDDENYTLYRDLFPTA